MVTIRQSEVRNSERESYQYDKELSSSELESSKSKPKPRRESGYKSDRSQED